MGIKVYVKKSWAELWNPDVRIWQYTDRALFVALPLISLVLFIWPTQPSMRGWADTMLNMAWIIPLALWLLFLLIVVPFRLVSKYHHRHESTIQELLHVYESGDRLKTAIFSDRKDNETATKLYKEWGDLLAQSFMRNPNELGAARLIGMVVDNAELDITITDDWKEPTAGIYILLSVQLRKLNLTIQNLCDRR